MEVNGSKENREGTLRMTLVSEKIVTLKMNATLEEYRLWVNKNEPSEYRIGRQKLDEGNQHDSST